MALRGEITITRALNRWLEKNKFACRVEEMSDEFYWDSKTDSIYYTVVMPSEPELLWVEMLKECGANFIIDTFYSSFLHEVFHSETYDMIDKTDIEYYKLMKYRVNEATYYRLPVEKEATMGMVDYINTHTEEVRELVETVSPLIMRFFKLNNIAVGE